MQRRRFLQTLLAVSGMSGILPHTRALTTSTSQQILLQTSPVAGFQYHDGENIWPQLIAGDELQLIREPHNPRDSQAVRIDWCGHPLGYVPRRDNTAVSQMLDRGERLSARIATLQYDPNPWRRVAVDIGLVSYLAVGA